MTGIVWIASYPRSGNTWMRFLLGNLIYRRIESSMQLSETIPDIHRFLRGRHLVGPDRTFIKTHWAWHPGFPLRENTERVIYLIRNPVDVLASSLNYAIRGNEAFAKGVPADQQDRFARDFVAQFILYGGDSKWYRLGYETWEGHARSWIETELPFPRLVVRYEALRKDPVATLAEIARFCGVDADPARVADAVARASKEAMAAMEDEEIRNRTPGIYYGDRTTPNAEAGFRFVGGDDRPSVALTDAERENARQRFAPAMKRFGYE